MHAWRRAKELGVEPVFAGDLPAASRTRGMTPAPVRGRLGSADFAVRRSGASRSLGIPT